MADPRRPVPTTFEGRVLERVAALEKDVSALQRGPGPIHVNDGPPTTSPRDGTAAGDIANARLWLRLDGGWRYVALS